MKQASNSLLTFMVTLFNRMPDAIVSREKTFALGCCITPFSAFQGKMKRFRSFCQDFATFPRRIVRIGLSEGRIRGLLYGVLIAVFLVLLNQISVPDMMAGDQLYVSLREDAATVAPVVRLRDVAQLSGLDASQLEKLGQTAIVESPAFGDTTILTRHQIREMIQNSTGPISPKTFGGAAAVRIRVQGRQITADEIKPVLKSYFIQSTPWKEPEITIDSIASLQGIELPPVQGGFRLIQDEAVIGTRNVLLPLEIVQGGKGLRTYWISAEMGIRAEVLAATGKIRPGKIVTKSDIVKKLVEIPDMRVSYMREPEEVLGKVSRRGLRPGDLLTREVFAEPFLVKSGETIRLRLQRDGIMLTSLVKAEQDGRLGQFIRVRSIEFSKFLKAEVIGRSEVRLQ
jgi:flagella basal body P-ring formation protein FlgA